MQTLENDINSQGGKKREMNQSMQIQDQSKMFSLKNDGSCKIISIGNMSVVSQFNLPSRRSIMEQAPDVRIIVNKIFQIRGGYYVDNLALDFSDGFLFQELFNILFDENVNCFLDKLEHG